MNPEEIINEKVMAIMTRNKARDVFDSYFLAKENKLKFNKDIITEKLGYYKILFSMEEFESNIEKKREMWKPELQSIVSISLPDFTDAKNFIMEQIKNEFGNTM
jgi:predicted nucleotidyltransferase component of viral defense system